MFPSRSSQRAVLSQHRYPGCPPSATASSPAFYFLLCVNISLLLLPLLSLPSPFRSGLIGHGCQIPPRRLSNMTTTGADVLSLRRSGVLLLPPPTEALVPTENSDGRWELRRVTVRPNRGRAASSDRPVARKPAPESLSSPRCGT